MSQIQLSQEDPPIRRDQDTRYTQFPCPLQDWTGIRTYRNSCPRLPNDPGTADNTPVVVNTCNAASSQTWTKRS